MGNPTVWTRMTFCPGSSKADTIHDASIVVDDGRVVWIGPADQLPECYRNWHVEDLAGNLVTPGLIDCHTHLVYGGDRASEFALRLAGASYEEVSRSGGGIMSTVRATRDASEDVLYQAASQRLEQLISDGVTAIEIKSGYGLNLTAERKMLRVARRLGQSYPVSVYTTFLGAHALPPEFTGNADSYIEAVCNEMLPVLCDEGLVDAVDAFCENIAFSIAQTDRVMNAAVRHGLQVKVHAEQLSNLGAAKLGAKYGALSADHLEYLDESGAQAMAASGTVAVLLPGAFYFIRETRLPPLDLLRKHEVPIAIATDSNPGTSPTVSMQLMMNMAATLFRMTVPEILEGVTTHAAKALGRADTHGLLEVGRTADFAVWSTSSVAELVYWMGRPLCVRTVKAGETVFRRAEHAQVSTMNNKDFA